MASEPLPADDVKAECARIVKHAQQKAMRCEAGREGRSEDKDGHHRQDDGVRQVDGAHCLGEKGA